MGSLSGGGVQSRTVCQINDSKNLRNINTRIKKLLLLVLIIHLLFISIDAAMALTVTKTGSTMSAQFGDTVVYDYKVTNNDGVNLTNVVFIDDRLGSISIGNLSAGGTWTHSISHKISVTDMPGPLVNNAWATGRKPNGADVTSTKKRWAISLGIGGSLLVTKMPDLVYVPMGGRVNYTIIVINPFSFDVNNITVDDVIEHPSNIFISVPLNRTNLAAGQTASGIVSYTSAQEDILGPADFHTPTIRNTAFANGYPPWASPSNPRQTVSGVYALTIGIDYITNIVVSKTANPVYGAPNSLTTFEINVTNSGDVLLNKTEITDLLPKGLTFINASPVVTSSTPNINGSTTLKWANLSQSFGRVLNPGEQFTIHVTASFNGNECGKLTNTVTGKGYNLRYFADGDDDDQKVFDSSTSSDFVDVLALKQNIAVVKTLDIASGSPGTVVNFTLNIQNIGNISLKDVFVSDLLPAGMSYISSPPGSTNSGLHVNWSNIGPIEIGASKQLWVKALIRGPVMGNDTLTNLVHVDGKPELGNNVTNSSTAIVQSQEAKIAVSKTADPAFGSPSTNVTFTLVVENAGSALLPHVSVRDLLPDGMSYVSSSPGSTRVGQNVSWSEIGPMSSGASRSLQIVAHIDGPISGTKNLTNYVDVTGIPKHGQNVTANSSAIVQAQEAKIAVSKTADPTFGSPSTNVTFTLVVENAGSALLPHVSVRDLLPDGMSYVSSSPGSTRVGQNVSWSDIGPMSSGASKSLQIVAHIDGPISGTKNLTNYVDVSGQPDHGQNVTANSSAIVQAQEAKITVSKTANPTFGSPSTNVTFTLLVENAGSAPLPHVSVRDLLPDGMSYVSSSPGSTRVGQNVSWSEIGPMSLWCQQIVADRSPYRRPHFRHQKSDQLRGRFRPTRSRPECHSQRFGRRSCPGSQDHRQQDRRSDFRLT